MLDFIKFNTFSTIMSMSKETNHSKTSCSGQTSIYSDSKENTLSQISNVFL